VFQKQIHLTSFLYNVAIHSRVLPQTGEDRLSHVARPFSMAFRSWEVGTMVLDRDFVVGTLLGAEQNVFCRHDGDLAVGF
jgi:hypothetical protein